MALQYSITAIGTMMVQSAFEPAPDPFQWRPLRREIERIVTPGVCGAWNGDGNLLCPEYGGGWDVQRIRHGFRSATILGSVYSVVVAVLMVSVGHYH